MNAISQEQKNFYLLVAEAAKNVIVDDNSTFDALYETILPLIVSFIEGEGIKGEDLIEVAKEVLKSAVFEITKLSDLKDTYEAIMDIVAFSTAKFWMKNGIAILMNRYNMSEEFDVSEIQKVYERKYQKCLEENSILIPCDLTKYDIKQKKLKDAYSKLSGESRIILNRIASGKYNKKQLASVFSISEESVLLKFYSAINDIENAVLDDTERKEINLKDLIHYIWYLYAEDTNIMSAVRLAVFKGAKELISVEIAQGNVARSPIKNAKKSNYGKNGLRSFVLSHKVAVAISVTVAFIAGGSVFAVVATRAYENYYNGSEIADNLMSDMQVTTEVVKEEIEEKEITEIEHPINSIIEIPEKIFYAKNLCDIKEMSDGTYELNFEFAEFTGKHKITQKLFDSLVYGATYDIFETDNQESPNYTCIEDSDGYYLVDKAWFENDLNPFIPAVWINSNHKDEFGNIEVYYGQYLVEDISENFGVQAMEKGPFGNFEPVSISWLYKNIIIKVACDVIIENEATGERRTLEEDYKIYLENNNTSFLYLNGCYNIELNNEKIVEKISLN